MARILHGDFETRSACNLKNAGADVYAKHETTDIMCLGYAFDDEAPKVLRYGEALPQEIRDHISSGGIFTAHNAAFELAIWNHVCVKKYGWPPLSIEQTRCTMAMAYAMGMPGALEKAAAALGIDQQKDMVGNRIMMQLSLPKEILADGSPVFRDDPDKFKIMMAYCAQDIVVEQAICKRLPQLNEFEQRLWNLDQKINERGIQIDTPAVESALKIVEAEKMRLDKKMREVTDSQVATCNATMQLTRYLESLGINCDGVAKSDVIDLLERDDLPRDIRTALELRQEAAKTSTAKLKPMLSRAGLDGRIRNSHQYHGSNTGRWAGRGLQLQNFPRPALPQQDIDEIVDGLSIGIVSDKTIREKHGSVMAALSSCLRGFITAKEGHELIACDFSAIEARVLPWLAGEEKVLEVFREGKDIYKYAAGEIYGKKETEVTKEERQIGKVASLALGYAGGIGAFKIMAKNYQVKVSDTTAESIKSAWREKHSKIVKYWYDLERAAESAIRNPGHKFEAGSAEARVTYMKKGSFLFCHLPSKRALCYPYAKIEEIVTPWGSFKESIVYSYVDSLTNKWTKGPTYGGSLAENCTQAVARDILAETLMRLEEKGLQTVMHVHDEVVLEVPKNTVKVEEIEQLISIPPAWAANLPLDAEGWVGLRYRK